MLVNKIYKKEYEELKNEVKKAIRREKKKKFHDKKIHQAEGNSNKFWKIGKYLQS